MDEQDKVLSAYRLSKAKQCLKSAEVILHIGDDYNLVINRSYYAVFHGMRSVLALEGKDFEKHSAVISYFRKEYIKTKRYLLKLLILLVMHLAIEMIAIMKIFLSRQKMKQKNNLLMHSALLKLLKTT